MLRLVKDLAKPLYRLFKQPNLAAFYRLSCLYGNAPRFKKFNNVNFNDYSIEIADGPSFVWQYRDIFVEELYNFSASTDEPVIYDCGANIGISIIYFKIRYPKAKVVAFEADSDIFSILKFNIENSELENVELINKAVWTSNEGVHFCSQGADAGAISRDGEVCVDSVALNQYLLMEERIDFLKIDIEGAETDVVLDCADYLHCVQNIFIEYHSFKDEPQALSSILAVLENSGFRYYLSPAVHKESPFRKAESISSMDLQINIYGYRH